MKNLTSIAFLLLLLPAYAQSKKIVNQQLRLELQKEKAYHDSLQLVHTAVQHDLKIVRAEVSEKNRLLDKLNREESSTRATLSRNRTLLLEKGYATDSLILKTENRALKSPSIDKRYVFNPELIRVTFQMGSVNAIEDLTDLKLKTQNLLLKQKVDEYDSVNNANQTILEEEKKLLITLTDTKKEYTAVTEKLTVFNRDLVEKSNLLAGNWHTLKKQEEEARYEAYLKELKVAEAKRKKKNPKVIEFIPPYVEDRNVEEEPVFIYLKSSEPESVDIPIVREVSEPPIAEIQAEFPGGQR